MSFLRRRPLRLCLADVVAVTLMSNGCRGRYAYVLIASSAVTLKFWPLLLRVTDVAAVTLKGNGCRGRYAYVQRT